MATNRARLCAAGLGVAAIFALTLAGDSTAGGLGGLAKSIRNIKPGTPNIGNPNAPKGKPEGKQAPAEKFVEVDVKFGFFVIRPDVDVINHFDLPKEGGLLVSRVRPDTPAAKAGLKENDFLLEMNGLSIPRDTAEFSKRVDAVKDGGPVNLILLRAGKRETIKGLTVPVKTAGTK